MGLLVQVIWLVLKVCGVASSLAIQGSEGYSISPSPATFSVTPPIGLGTPGNETHGKSLRSNAPSPASQPDGSFFHPPLVMPPLKSAPVPQAIKGLAPSLSPSIPTMLPPYTLDPPPSTFHGTIPSLPPSAPQRKPPQMKNPVLVPEAPVPIVSPSQKSPQTPPAIHPVTPGPTPLSSHRNEVPGNKASFSGPFAPVQIAPPPREMLQNPPTAQPIIPQPPPPILPVPVVSPPRNLPRNLQPIHPTLPKVPPSNLTEPDVSPVSTPPPSINWERDGMPVAAPSNVMPKRFSPTDPSPMKAPVHRAPKHSSNAPLPISVFKSPPHTGFHSPASLPSTSYHRHQHAMKNITSPAPLVPPPASTGKQGPFTPQAPLYSPKLAPNSKQRHHPPPLLNPEPHVSPVSTPPLSINWERDGMPVAAPSNVMPKRFSPTDPSPMKAPVHRAPKHSSNAPLPISVFKSPPHTGFHSPASLPSTSYHRHQHAMKNITSPAPLVPPPASTGKQGPFTPQAPLYSPKLAPNSKQRHHPPPLLNPEPHVSPVSTPPLSINWERDGMPVAAPSNVMPKRFSPTDPSPMKAPVHRAPKHSSNAPLPISVFKSPPHTGFHSPASLPSTSYHRHQHAMKNITSPAPLVPPPASTGKQGPFTPQAPLYSPKLAPNSKQRHHPPPLLNPEPHVSPVSTPPLSINWERDGMPVAAPSNVMPKRFSPTDPSPMKAPVHRAPKHSSNAPPPISVFKSPPHTGFHSPASLPSTLYHRHQHATKNITSPAPLSYLVPPPASTDKQGPFTPPAPLYSPKLSPNSKQSHHLPPLLNPVSSVPPSQSPFLSSDLPMSTAPIPSPSGQTKMLFLSPKISPSGSSPRNAKMPLLPPIQALPPPPPNEDCTSITCTEPLTNTPPGPPCGCVWPMQVGLRLSVALYTFFPLVSELASEISVGVFMKQSQVRIMGANVANQDPEKTTVLIDLVPLGEKIDNTTAYLIYQRFWHKQVVIRTLFFGDYEVLYVRYPGLPPSPPSSINIIDGNPGNDNNGRTIKPLGVDVNRRRQKDGLTGGVIAIIVLSASIAVILCCAIAWILLFKYRDRVCQPEQLPPAMVPSLAKSSGVAASMIGSGPSSVSLSFASSIQPYTGSAKIFSSSDIERATDNLDASRILGEGGFGRVYSGVLEDGTEVAVKVLKRDDQQGGREFLAEVEMLGRLHHRNLVKLIGICTEERSRCLVYELIPNGSVESHLHGVDKDTAPLDWISRMKIALGAARGLAYLHEDSSPRVIHRDFKSSNILLEHDFTPKVSDFGLARTALDEENKHISTRVMGTFGYVAPEYAMTGHLLVKSDVYSYGVVLLELLTGRKPVDMSQPPGQENLVTWARPLLTVNEGLESIVDPSLGPNFPFNSITKVAAIASMCAQPEVSHRPFMGEVVQALKLVCNECDEAKDLGSRSGSQEDLSVDFDPRVGTNWDHLPGPMQTHSPLSNYESALDVERGLSVSDLFSASARFGIPESGSFRRHSSSGPLRAGRGRTLPLWQRMRRLSGGSVSEHGVLFRLWHGSH